jgi:uncharacterized cofD-like protein
MRIVGIGGGTGLPRLLSGLRELRDAGQLLDITAIVTVADSGGSTGVLREAFKMPAMGDIRKCMIALAAEESVLTHVCRHRFDNPAGFAGHSLGNLILSALYQMSGNFAGAVRQACELLHLKGRVLPATEYPLTLCAVYDDGGLARGESNIPQTGRRIRRVWFEAAETAGATCDRMLCPSAAPGVIEALRQADAIVMGPGSLYTSIIPNLLVAGVPEAIRESSAIKIYVSNLMTQPGETEGYSVADHVHALLEYVSPINVCVLNSSAVGTGVAERYLKSGSQIVSSTPGDEHEIRRSGVITVGAPLLRYGEIKARHDPATLARLIVSLVNRFARCARDHSSSEERKVICAE